jgi:1-acyl-sn-glycerol-3-phosphate acyltransferase
MIPAVYWGSNRICRWLLLAPYASVKQVGRENIPLTGPLIVASNHLHDADPCIFGFFFPRMLRTLAKQELFKYPGLRHFLQGYGAVPVRRGEADLAALRRANELLEEGYAVCIFPEGTSSKEKAQLKEGYPGAGLIALRSGIPVLPMAITGSQRLGLPQMFFRLPLLSRQRVTITYGKPFLLDKPARINGESARAATQEIMQRIAALLPPEYRGYYGDASSSDAEHPAPSGAGE